MKTVYNKLVRDRIPEIIEASGKSCTCQVLDDQAYLAALDEKLNEELSEYRQDKSMEELADLLEVIRAVITVRGSTWDEVESLRKAKAEERGGFAKKILLVETDDAQR